MILSNVSDIEKHSAAHVLAMALARIYPNVKIGIGPVTKDGFYYDFDLGTELTPKKLQQVEEEIKKIVKEDLQFQQIIIPRQEGINMMLQRGQIYKTEIINSIPDEEISFFKTGDEFIDLCRGPHVNSTNELGPIKIVTTDDVFWNNDSSRPKMKRIMGMVFRNQEELENFEKVEIEKLSRDYKKVAVANGYGFHEENRFILSELGYRFVEKLYNEVRNNIGIEEIRTYRANSISNNYQEEVRLIDRAIFLKDKSYRDFPITILSRIMHSESPLKDRISHQEVFLLKRYLRQNEVTLSLNFFENFIKIFNDFELDFFADIKYKNIEDPVYTQVSNALQRSFISHNKVQNSKFNDIVIDLKARDDIGREWDFASMSVKLEESDTKISLGGKVFPIVTLEVLIYPVNTLVFFIENFKNKFPNLLNPRQFIIIPVSKRFDANAEEVKEKLRKAGVFSEIAYGNSSFKSKIRRFENLNIPVLLIVGQKEVDNNSVSLRINDRDEGLITIDNLNSYLEANFFNK